jgi:hypothetical protein
MDVSDAEKLKALEAENARLKKLLAETVLEKDVLHGLSRLDGIVYRDSRLLNSRSCPP